MPLWSGSTTASYLPAKFGGHRHFTSEDVMVLLLRVM